MITLCLERLESFETQTLGRLDVYDSQGAYLYGCDTLELPWRNNKRRESCIPANDDGYRCIHHLSPTFGETLWVKDVPNRSEILVHAGNFYDDTLGCILVGQGPVDINGDGFEDITHSRDTLRGLLDILPEHEDLTLIIKDLN